MTATLSNVVPHISEFSPDKGLAIGKNNRAMTYLYGLSDFWSYMFEDTETLNTILEANAVAASDIYNKFLQLTSGISLDDISATFNTQVKLVLINETDLVPGTVATYTLKEKIASARYVVNRPLLPTSSLEGGVDFHIDPDKAQISFARLIYNNKFAYRTTSNGTKEYALWLIDATIDENLVYEKFAKFIGVDQPARSTTDFRNFVYGLYYMYINGPTLSLIKKGLNIALGIPLARDNEQVIDVRQYPNTDQYIVITNTNSYLIPYGLAPAVAIGDSLSVGSELANWVEVKDYTNDGDWWINFMIPESLMPNIPNDVAGRTRYAVPGSYADTLMRTYLKSHTFLVNVKTVGFKNLQTFELLADIIHDVKPMYSAPIYVWSVPVPDEKITFNDGVFGASPIANWCQSIGDGIYRFTRDSTFPMLRGCPQFIRMSASARVDRLLGRSAEANGSSRNWRGGVVTGYMAPQAQFRNLDTKETGWINEVFMRGNPRSRVSRSVIGFARNRTLPAAGVGYNYLAQRFPDRRLVYLYTTTLQDIQVKYAVDNSSWPGGYINTLLAPRVSVDSINVYPVDSSTYVNNYSTIIANFSTLFTRGSTIYSLGTIAARDSYQTFSPSSGDVQTGDYLVIVNIYGDLFSVYWATTNQALDFSPTISHNSEDVLQMTFTSPLSRGIGKLGNPYYLLRGTGLSISLGGTDEINHQSINIEGGGVKSTMTASYSDPNNANQTITRNGSYSLTTVRTFTN